MTSVMEKGQLGTFIIQRLAAKPGLSARTILDDCRKHGISTSLSGLYKELGRMCDSSILFKVEQTYRLHLNWVHETIELSALIYRNYLEGAPFLPELPPAGKQTRWKITSFHRLNDLFTNVVLRLVRDTRSHLHLSWNPHPWLHLVQTHQEEVFFKTLKRYKVRMYKIVGSQTPLSKWSEQFWDPRMVCWSYAPSPFRHMTNIYFSIVDDYIVTVELNAKTVRRLDVLYQGSLKVHASRLSRRSESTLVDPRQFASLFDEKTQAVLTLRHNPKRAAAIRQRYLRHFGKLVPGTQELKGS